MSTPGSDVGGNAPVAPDAERRETAPPDTVPPDTVPSAPRPPRIELGQPVAAGHETDADDRGSGDTVAGQDDDPGGRWREIQTLFVDDPRGSVERALQAVDSELTTLITALQERRSAVPRGRHDTAADDGDTERLRVAVRSCRTFWHDLTELTRRLRAQDQSAVTAPPGGRS